MTASGMTRFRQMAPLWLLLPLTAALPLGCDAPGKPNPAERPVTPDQVVCFTELYRTNCSGCHGADGKGNGPAASSLKVPPTDLTQMARKHDGKFPANYLASTLKFGSGTAAGAHGSVDMPVWGPLFQSLDRFHDTSVQQRVSNLVGYVESIQAQ